MIYFTADNHFHHRQIIDFCDRPFRNVDDMNAEMIERWNMTLEKDDQIYILGDFLFGGVGKVTEVLSQLIGYKILIMGNHDHRNHSAEKWKKLGMDEVIEDTTMRIAGEIVNLSHFPYKRSEHDDRTFDSQLEDDGNILIHGHAHTSWKIKKRMINVGVDQWDFTPIPFKKIEYLIKGIK